MKDISLPVVKTVTIRVVCEEITEQNAHKAYPWLNPERN